MSQTPGVKVVRVTANGGALGGLHHLPSLRHVIAAGDRCIWWNLPSPPDSVRTMTLLINIHAGSGRLARPSYSGKFRHVRHITVVLRAVPSLPLPTAEVQGWDEDVALLHWVRLPNLRMGCKYTFVNVTEETKHAHGLDPGFGSATDALILGLWQHFMVLNKGLPPVAPDSTLNVDDYWAVPKLLEGDFELLERGVRVLSMGEWRAEASQDDLDASVDFW
jgi:hypothetical protein